MTKQKWTVVYLQEQSAVILAQQTLNRTTTLLAILISALVSVFATLASNIFTRPILNLTDSAVKIAAGDLSTPTRVTSSDEIGILGNAFNSMTDQLRESIQTLESRVRERTQQLGLQNETLLYRSRQLQTVADVARGMVTTTDFESLLNTITTLISERFNYYHVGVFLIDEVGEFAVLRASNSAGGQRMLERQHKLKVGQVGIVGFVTGAGQARIATDVGKDAVFFNNPDLPETKSEMALPLKIEDRVIGALDIQSTESNAFTEEDISLFETLADQVSAAINTNQLLTNTEIALAEAQTLHRQYLDQEWTKRTTEIEMSNYKYTSRGLIKTDENLPEIRMVFDSNRPVTRSYTPEGKDAQPYSVLAIPILLRGQAIGVIHLRRTATRNLSGAKMS
jgi:nitrate/nitrite-specific signal transduction histidine kinase